MSLQSCKWTSTEGEWCCASGSARSLRLPDRGAFAIALAVAKHLYVGDARLDPENSLALRTPLYDTHVAANARMVDFGGWDMPVNYGSQIDEHHAVRRDAGMFDVSHMCVIDLHGARIREFLRYLLANDVARVKTAGKALYSCMLNERGGVIDDLIVYFMSETWFRMVVNAGTRDKDIAWIKQQSQPFNIDVKVRTDLAMIAVQATAREKSSAGAGCCNSRGTGIKAFYGR